MTDEKQARHTVQWWVALTNLTWLVMAALVCNGVHASEPSGSHALRLEIATAVSPEFQKEFEAARQTIPPAVWQALSQTGWRVCLTELVIDALPELDGVHPRGWPQGATWNNTDAVHLPRKRLMVFAEKRRNRKGKIVGTHRVAQVVRHEVGHAFDSVAGDSRGLYSASEEFYAAYHRDLKLMSDEDRKSLAYFTQPGHSGRQEAFAEAFAISLGSGSDLENRDRFPAAFKSVMKLVSQLLRESR